MIEDYCSTIKCPEASGDSGNWGSGNWGSGNWGGPILPYIVTAFYFLFVLFLLPNAVSAQAECPPVNSDIPIRSTLASAGFFANLRNAPHSINFLMDQLLAQAHIAANQKSASETECQRPCPGAILATVFESIPSLTLSDYDEAEECQKLFDTTKLNPISYEGRTFESDQEAKDWYRDLTQGEGSDGEDLYARCPGSCSPAYSSLVYMRQNRFVISTSIVCGHARDRDDGLYRLTASLRWICPRS